MVSLTANHYVIALSIFTVFALWWLSRDIAGVKSQVADLKSYRVEDFDDVNDDVPPVQKRVHFEDETFFEQAPDADDADDDADADADPVVSSPAPPPAPPPATDL
jgi:hypothetical protein